MADIKEAVFWGSEHLPSPLQRRTHAGYKGYIVSGSDCGRVFIWDRASSKLVASLMADTDVLNCVQVCPLPCASFVTWGHCNLALAHVQPNPFRPWLATSGIESVVRLWTPAGSSFVRDDDEGTPSTGMNSSPWTVEHVFSSDAGMPAGCDAASQPVTCCVSQTGGADPDAAADLTSNRRAVTSRAALDRVIIANASVPTVCCCFWGGAVSHALMLHAHAGRAGLLHAVSASTGRDSI